MKSFALAGDALKSCFQGWRLWLIQLLVNPLLFALFTAWLLLPVASTGHLILNALLALVLACVALILNAGTLNYFSLQSPDQNASVKDAFGRAIRHLLAVALCALVIFLLWGLVAFAHEYRETFPAYLRSNLPAFVRKLAGQSFFNRTFDIVLFTLQWILFPGITLPLLASASCFGFRGLGRKGFAAWKKTVFSLPYWVILILASLVGVLATQQLMGWKPDFRTSTFQVERISLVVRFLASYFLGIFGWMLACSVVGCGSRDLEQPPSDLDGQAVA